MASHLLKYQHCATHSIDRSVIGTFPLYLPDTEGAASIAGPFIGVRLMKGDGIV